MSLFTRACLTVAAVAAATSLTACEASVSTGKTIDSGNAEKLIGEQLSKQFGGGKVAVDCPQDIKAEKGGTFTCTATSPDGKETAKVEATQKDDKGNFSFVAKPQ